MAGIIISCGVSGAHKVLENLLELIEICLFLLLVEIRIDKVDVINCGRGLVVTRRRGHLHYEILPQALRTKALTAIIILHILHNLHILHILLIQHILHIL